MHLVGNAWTAIDLLLILWKFYVWWNKRGILPKCSYVSTTDHLTLMKRLEKKLDRNYIRKLFAVLNKSWKQLSTKQVVWPLTSHLVNHPSKMSKTCWALLEKQGWSHKQCFSIDSHAWTHQCWLINKKKSLALCRRFLRVTSHRVG